MPSENNSKAGFKTMKVSKAQFKSKGGIHPAYNKQVTSGAPVEPLPSPGSVFVSMSQHLGAPASPVVKKGDNVEKGGVIAEPAGFISASIHAPVSGVVKAVGFTPSISTGQPVQCIEIESDGQDKWTDTLRPRASWRELDAKALIERVAAAGIAGMGGAGFPTHVKLSPPPEKHINTLIINGAECEPYLTADHRLMVEQADMIWGGIEIIRHILNVKSVYIAIEDNKPDAVTAMAAAIEKGAGDAVVVKLKTEYPQGAEKQMIYAVTGREVPSGGLPMDVGALVENVGTCQAVFDAVVNGRPLIERVVTVTGDAVRNPKNVLARTGTPFSALIDFCGGLSDETGKLICGGPMMGFAQSSADAAVTKTTSGLLALSRKAISQFESTPCISCGRCVGACPMRLLPCSLSEFIEAEDYEGASGYNVLDCIECGSCAFVCPAHRPLVQHMRRGKAELARIKREKG